MTFLPIDKMTLTTKITDQQIVSRLKGITDTDNNFPLKNLFSGTDKSYSGTVTANGFEIQRIINYKNPCLPISFGRIEKDFDVTKIKIEMRLKISIIIIFIIVAILPIFLAIAAHIEYSFLLKFLLVFYVLFYVQIMIQYKIESKKTKRDLTELFEAQQDA
jgi:hypothetical protein